MSEKQASRERQAYRERARAQTLAWADGSPYHEPVNDECCPDFSCCYPDLFTASKEERWQHYAKKFGRLA